MLDAALERAVVALANDDVYVPVAPRLNSAPLISPALGHHSRIQPPAKLITPVTSLGCIPA